MFRRQLFNVSRLALRHMATEAETTSGKLVMTGERSFNKVTLLGRSGRDAEMRGTEEYPVALFPLATSFSIKKPDGTYEQKTEWHKVAVFRRGLRDMVANTISAGDRVFVSGSINYSSYESNGEVKSSTSIIADEVIFLSPKKSKEDKSESQ